MTTPQPEPAEPRTEDSARKQWHPWAGFLLQLLLGKDYELQAEEPVSVLPRRSDFVLAVREEAHPEIPVWTGFAPAWAREGVDVIEAPRIESPDDPVTALGDSHPPAGLGLLGRAWQPRLARAGTYDDAWLERTWPRLPSDFDFAYWNAAHPDLTARRWLRGDEAVELVGLFADGPRRFRLPGVWVYVLAIPEDGPMLPFPMKLDTVSFDVDAGTAALVWRLALPTSPAFEAIEPRMAARVGA